VAFGEFAAIAVAAIPKVNKADVIKVPDLFMGSPAVVLTSATRNTPDQRDHVDAKDIRLRALIARSDNNRGQSVAKVPA
jgi:hypothetical protein